MKRFAAMFLAGLLCAGLAGCSGQPNDVSEELAGLSSQLEAINQRLDKLEESAGNQEGLSSYVDSLTKRLEALESAAQQPTPAPEEPSSTAEEPSAAVSTSVGQVVYDEGGIKVTYTGMEDYALYGSIVGVNFNFSIENSTDQSPDVCAADCSINGLMMGSGFMEGVASGKVANTDITVWNDELEDNGITNIETLEFTIQVFGNVLQEAPVTIAL